MKKASGVSAGLSSSYNDAKWLREGQRKVKGRTRKVKERCEKITTIQISGKDKRRSKKDVKKVLLCKI